MRIIIMGPPGAGKGTEAELLLKQYQIPHISSGEIFRSLLKQEGSPLAKEVASFINHGNLVPDELANRVIVERLEADDCHNGFLLDGYPRTINQASQLEKTLKEKNWTLDAIISLVAPDETIIERLSSRLVCPACGRTYHKINKKPKVEGLCDFDQVPLIQREDDKPETVRLRLNVYHKQTKPLIEYYKNHHAYVEIDASKAIKYAHEEIMKVLGEHSDSN